MRCFRKIFAPILLLFIFFSLNAYAEVVKKIEVTGNDRVSKETIVVFGDITIGKDYEISDVNTLIKKLYDTTLFSNISVNIKNNVLSIVVKENPMINSLKLEGEDSATIAKGFGAAIGGIGTERFKIEEVATTNNIPILAIVIKQTIKEAITLMSEDIAKQAQSVRNQIYDMIKENSKSGQTVMVIGVGNTLGILQ